MVKRTQPSFKKRTIAIAVTAIVLWGAFAAARPLAGGHAVSLFGLPLDVALTLPVIVPAFVIIMFWLTTRQGTEDERFGDDG